MLQGGRCGIARYIGTPSFAPGVWVGIELESPGWFTSYWIGVLCCAAQLNITSKVDVLFL